MVFCLWVVGLAVVLAHTTALPTKKSPARSSIWTPSPVDRNAVELPPDEDEFVPSLTAKMLNDSMQHNLQATATATAEHSRRVDDWNNMFDESVHEFQQMGFPQAKIQTLKRLRPMLQGLVDVINVDGTIREAGVQDESILAQVAQGANLPFGPQTTSLFAKGNQHYPGHHPKLTPPKIPKHEEVDMDKMKQLSGISFTSDQLSELWGDVLDNVPEPDATKTVEKREPEVADIDSNADNIFGFPMGQRHEGKSVQPALELPTDADYVAEELEHSKLTQVEHDLVAGGIAQEKQHSSGGLVSEMNNPNSEHPQSRPPSRINEQPDGAKFGEQAEPFSRLPVDEKPSTLQDDLNYTPVRANTHTVTSPLTQSQPLTAPTRTKSETTQHSRSRNTIAGHRVLRSFAPSAGDSPNVIRQQQQPEYRAAVSGGEGNDEVRSTKPDDGPQEGGGFAFGSDIQETPWEKEQEGDGDVGAYDPAVQRET